MPRDRTKSTREENNVTSFVTSVIDFKSNVECFPLDKATADATALTLYLIPQKDSAVAFAKPAGWDSTHETAAGRANVGSVYPFDLTNGCRAAIGVLPTSKVSRNNCPVRPDVITSLVGSALGGIKGFTSLNVVACFAEDFSTPVASSVARGSKRNFSAKSGLADKAYYEACVPIRVFANSASHVRMDITANATQLAMRLVDAPTNLLDTTTFPEIAEAYSRKLGFTFNVMCGEELREKGYGGIYGVGKAAEFPPALVTLSYKPKAGISPKDKIAFVGKGIVYDTGGLSIKTPGTGMCGMKMDMGGSAAVFAAFLGLVQAGAPYEIDCVLCIADNAIGPRAQRNDDIVIMKSGKTVELNNTDAEGRLVLGDGVWHAAAGTGGKAPSLILDMATLTGAQGIATGSHHGGLWTNSADWESRMVQSGLKAGEMVFPLLYAPEFHVPEFNSAVADMRNSVRNRANAQSSCAAAFIAENLPVEYQGAHVHIDMAYPAKIGEGATGYGAALLIHTFSQ